MPPLRVLGRNWHVSSDGACLFCFGCVYVYVCVKIGVVKLFVLLVLLLAAVCRIVMAGSAAQRSCVHALLQHANTPPPNQHI
jgi:hypothetical protein